ncbi:MAG TPA: DUF1844 domain-containing protein [Phycisphaerae bacterium]|nr:DUF1844 domain-containing protein [Phycisphaerae bacterium]
MDNTQNQPNSDAVQMDSGFKAQAEKEKEELARKLGEMPAQQRKPEEKPAAAAAGTGKQKFPPASFEFLVEQYATQILMALGAITPPGGKRMIDLDLAKFYIDLLGVVDEKTKNNLSPEEQKLISTALYDMRMMYVTVLKQGGG